MSSNATSTLIQQGTLEAKSIPFALSLSKCRRAPEGASTRLRPAQPERGLGANVNGIDGSPDIRVAQGPCGDYIQVASQTAWRKEDSL